MILSAECDSLYPIIRFFKFSFIPIIQVGVPIILIIVGMITLLKAIASSKEEDIKKAQQLLVKKLIYAVSMFLLILATQTIISFVDTDTNDEKESLLACWANTTKTAPQGLDNTYVEDNGSKSTYEVGDTSKGKSKTETNKSKKGKEPTSKNDKKTEYYTPTSSKSFWWPVGSTKTVKDKDGILYAPYEPAWTAIDNTGHFGKRTYINGNTEDHTGIDIIESATVSHYLNYKMDGVIYIIAVADGEVVALENSCYSHESDKYNEQCGGTYGNFITINHGNGLYTHYAHIHQGSITVSMNQKVKQGQVIAKIGSSGRASEPHVHFEVRDTQYYIAGHFLDPEKYISLSNTRPK